MNDTGPMECDGDGGSPKGHFTIRIVLVCSGLQVDDLQGNGRIEFQDDFARALDLEPAEVEVTDCIGWDNIQVFISLGPLGNRQRAIQLLHTIGEHRSRWWWWWNLVQSAAETGTVNLKSIVLDESSAACANEKKSTGITFTEPVPITDTSKSSMEENGIDRLVDNEEVGEFKYKLTPALTKFLVLTTSPMRLDAVSTKPFAKNRGLLHSRMPCDSEICCAPSGHRLEPGAEFMVKRRLSFLNERDDGGKQVYLELSNNSGWATMFNPRNGALLAANTRPNAGDLDETWYVAMDRVLSSSEQEAVDEAAPMIEMEVYRRLKVDERKDARLVIQAHKILTKSPITFPDRRSFSLPVNHTAHGLLAQVGAITRALLTVASELALESPRIEIQSHTHRRKHLEDESTHEELSRERAAFIMRTLIADGKVPAKSLTAMGYGSAFPVDKNKPWLSERIEFRIIIPQSWGANLGAQLGLKSGISVDPIFVELKKKFENRDVPDGGIVTEGPPRIFTTTSAVEKYIIIREKPSFASKPTGARLHRDEFFDVDKRYANGKSGRAKEVWLRMSDQSGWFPQFHARSHKKLAIDFVALGGEESMVVKARRDESAARLAKCALYGGLLSSSFARPVDADERNQNDEVKDTIRKQREAREKREKEDEEKLEFLIPGIEMLKIEMPKFTLPWMQ